MIPTGFEIVGLKPLSVGDLFKDRQITDKDFF